MLLLEQGTTRKEQVNENNATKLDTGNNESKKYKKEAICNNAVYTRQSANHLSKLYYLVFWKCYLEKKNT